MKQYLIYHCLLLACCCCITAAQGQSVDALSPFSMGELQAHLPDAQTAILCYVWGDSSLYIAGLSRQHSSQLRLPLSDSLHQRISQLCQWVAQPPAEAAAGAAVHDFATLAYGLYQEVVAPALEPVQTGISRLLIIPDGPLRYLPFGCLLTRPLSPNQQADFATLPYLLRQFELYHAAGPHFWEDQKPAERRAFSMFGAFTPHYPPQQASSLPHLPPGLQLLPLSAARQQETEVLADLLQGYVFREETASEAGFRRYARRFRLLHLNAYSLADDSLPEVGGIFFPLSDTSTHTEWDGPLPLQEIESLRLRAELLMLTNHQCRRGPQPTGAGMARFVQALHTARCTSLGLNLWQTDEQATTLLMQAFYTQLKQGSTKTHALRLAQLELIDQKKYASPYFWAAWVLYGNHQAIDFGNVWGYLSLWGGGILLLLLTSLLLRMWKRSRQ